MRIIAGEWRGRVLQAPSDRQIRPTRDRVRENLFNVLCHRVDITGLRVLDLCAGTGALGLEALSRGAARCIFIERNAAARAIITHNVAALGAHNRSRIIAADVHALPRALEPCDLIFLDPPYAEDNVSHILTQLHQHAWVGPDALLCLEQPAGQTISAPGWCVDDTRRYGRTEIVYLRATIGPDNSLSQEDQVR